MRGISWARSQVLGSVVAALFASSSVAGLAHAVGADAGPAPQPMKTVRLENVGEIGGPVIVQAKPGAVDEARRAVERLGGTIGDPLPLVDGFEADLPAGAAPALSGLGSVATVTPDRKVTFENLAYDAATTASNFVNSSGASAAWKAGNLGEGVGVAVIDTGISSMNDFSGRVVHGPDLSGEGSTIDSYGHGTVMAGVIGGSGADSAGSGRAYTGVAPKATLVSVKAAGRNGVTDVSTVLQAMHWVSAYKDQFNIRVLNISWGTPSTQDPAVDPLNYAVQRLWRQGIVVVVAAGNSGPQSGTIMKPADDPVVLTVGAYDDKQNTDPRDDAVASWSSRGPTAAGLSKPDVVAPGRTLIASRSYGSTVEGENPKALVSPSYIKGSGSSQAAALTSGLAALLVAQRPELTPDQVKHLLTSTADPIGSTAATSQGKGRVRLDRALTASAQDAPAQATPATGLGSLEASRGGRHVQTDCEPDGVVDVIEGEITDRCQEWNGNSWTGNSWTGNSWTGNSWTGNSWTGNSWTGNSWTNASWTGNSWTGGTWTGNSWTGNSWTGNSWTGNSWTGNSWTGNSWTGNSWTGNSWTGAAYGDEDTTFLTKFWGTNPPSVAGLRALRSQSER